MVARNRKLAWINESLVSNLLWEYWGISQHASIGLQLTAGIGASYPSSTPFLISACLLYSRLLHISILFPSLCSRKKIMASAHRSWVNIILAQKDSQGNLQIPRDNYNGLNLHQLFILEPIRVIIRISQRKKARESGDIAIFRIGRCAE